MEYEDENQYQYFSKCVGGGDGGVKVEGSYNAAFADNLLERTFPDKNKWAKDKRKNWS